MWIVLVLAGVLTSCGQQSAPPAPAARFERLRLPLSSVTVQSGRVADDLARLGSFMDAGQSARARLAAADLKIESLSFARRAGSTGNFVRGLLAGERQPQLQQYFRLTLQTLSAQWYEGMSLARLADIVWADPRLATGQSQWRFDRVEADARRYAQLASATAARAAALRRQSPAAFRYAVTRDRFVAIGL